MQRGNIFWLFLLVMISAIGSAASADWQWVNPLPHLETVRALEPAEHGFIGVGDGGRIFLTDGLLWTTIESGVPQILRGVVWNGEIYVAVGSGGVVLISSDARSWQQRSIGVDVDLYDVIWHDGRFLAVGNAVAISSDGVHWSVHEIDRPNLRSVLWFRDRFVAVGVNATVSSSADGVVWQEGTIDFRGSNDFDPPIHLEGLAENGSRIVAVGGYTYSGVVLYPTVLISEDGLHWVEQYCPQGGQLQDVAWTGGEFVATGHSDARDMCIGRVVTSSEGHSWQSVPDLFDACAPSPFTVANKDDRTVVTGRRVVLSRSGSNDWIYQDAHLGKGTVVDLVHTSTVLVALSKYSWYNVTGTEATSIMHTSDGVNWSDGGFVGGDQWLSPILTSLAWNGQFLVAVGYETATSTDGVAWEVYDNDLPILNDVIWHEGKFVAVGREGTIVRSVDGQVWVADASHTDRHLEALVAGPAGRMVVVGDGVVLTRGLYGPWMQAEHDWYSEVWFQSVAYGNGRYVAVGGDTVGTSDDALNWHVERLRDVFAVVWTGSEFVAVGPGGSFRSEDGLAWQALDLGTSQTMTGLVSGALGTFAFGWQAAILRLVDERPETQTSSWVVPAPSSEVEIELFNPADVARRVHFATLHGADTPARSNHTLLPQRLGNLSQPTASLANSGALVIADSPSLHVRAFERSGEGRTRRFVALPTHQAGESPLTNLVLPELMNDDQFRTDFDAVNLGGEEAAVTVEVLDVAGSYLDSVTLIVPPHGHAREIDVLGMSGVERAYGVVANSPELVKVWGTVRQRENGRTLFVSPPTRSIIHEAWLPFAVSSSIANGGHWTTSLTLINPGAHRSVVKLELQLANRPIPTKPPTIEVTLDAGQALRLHDVIFRRLRDRVPSKAGIGPGFTGAVRIAVLSEEVAAFGRMVHSSDPSLSQSVPVSDANDGGADVVLVGLRQVNGGSRTEVGILNTSDLPIEVEVALVHGDGGLIGNRRFNVGAGANLVMQDVLEGVGEVMSGSAVVSTNTPGGRLLAWASVIDEISKDRIFIPGEVIRSN